MKKMQTADKRIALYVPPIKADYDWGTQAFTFDFVTLDKENRVRNPSDSDHEMLPFADLRFRCQASTDMNGGKPFAYTLDYSGVHNLDLRRAECVLKTLKRIEKAEKAFPVHPETFGQYVALHCAALGVRDAVQPGKGNGWHDETEHVFWKGFDIQWLVDRKIAEFLTEHGEAMMRRRAS